MPTFLKAVAVFIGMFVVYAIASYLDPTPIYKDFTMDERVSTVNTLKTTLMSLLPIYAYYYFGRRGLLSEQNITRYFVCLMVLVTIMFIRQQNALLAQAIEMRNNADEFTNNIAYDFLQLMPLLVFLKKKPVWQYAALVYIMILILLGMKRGAILIGIVCVLYFVYQSYKIASRKNRRRIVALMIIATACVAYFASDFIASSEYFQSRVDDTLDGNSSGRDIIYSRLIEHLLARNSVGTIICGEGLNQTVVIAGKYAHNDWLELGINMGLLGVFVYFLCFVALGKHILQMRKSTKVEYNALVLCFIIMFTSALFSMSYGSLSVGITIVLGYCLANVKHKNIPRQIYVDNK